VFPAADFNLGANLCRCLQQEPFTGLAGEIKQSSALFRLQSCPVILQTGKEKRVLLVQSSDGKTSALQPTGLTGQARERGDLFAAPGQVEPNFGDRRLQLAALRQDALSQGMTNAVAICWVICI
jgi:hypothetical protein